MTLMILSVMVSEEAVSQAILSDVGFSSMQMWLRGSCQTCIPEEAVDQGILSVMGF